MTPDNCAPQAPGANGNPVSAVSLTPLQAWWHTRTARERRALQLAGAVLGAAGLWMLLVAPAWRTLQGADAENARLDAQWAEMQALAADAVRLRKTPVVAPVEAVAALHAATTQLGNKGQLSIRGERAVITLQGLSLDELGPCLQALRSGARTRPIEMSLTRDAGGYSGNLVLALPAKP